MELKLWVIKFFSKRSEVWPDARYTISIWFLVRLQYRALTVEVDKANATLHDNWNLLSWRLKETSVEMTSTNSTGSHKNRTLKKKIKREMLTWCHFGSTYLYEGHHVSMEKFVIVHQTAAWVILSDTHNSSTGPVQSDNIMWIHSDALRDKQVSKGRKTTTEWLRLYLCWYPFDASARRKQKSSVQTMFQWGEINWNE